MGKIKVRILGTDQEEVQKNKSKQKNKERKLVKGRKGGERVAAVGPSEEELVNLQSPNAAADGKKTKLDDSADKKTLDAQTQKKKQRGKTKQRARSKSYLAASKNLDKNKKYSLPDALGVLEKLKRSKFDETVELHINTIGTGISGSATLPHGTGKQIRIAIADDNVLAKIALGKIEFDILLASPLMMPKLAKVAKILGPRGLMPNPKNATLNNDPEKAAKNFKKGQVNFKTEAKIPIMHLTVGKISFGAKKLSENIETLIEAIKKEKIRNATLKSTMSPGIKISL